MTARLKSYSLPLAALLLGIGLFAMPALAASKTRSFTGEVSDSMCGAKHMMAGSPAACTRACVAKGANYALVVGEKVYTLNTTNKTALAQLDKLAGEKARVTGTEDGDTISVKSVSAAK
jgi:hypothetical protein